MFVADVIDYARLLIQEPDSTFFTDAQMAAQAKMAYREFRALVTRTDPSYYATTATFSPTTNSYDLALATNPVCILGSGALTGPRMRRLLVLATVGTTGYDDSLRGVTDRRALLNGSNSVSKYLLEGSILYFDTSGAPGSLRITYDPIEAVDWTQLTAPPNTYIDDLDDFHDIIALFMARRYHIVDASVNPGLASELSGRSSQLADFLSSGRIMDSNSIQRVDGYDGGGW